MDGRCGGTAELGFFPRSAYSTGMTLRCGGFPCEAGAGRSQPALKAKSLMVCGQANTRTAFVAHTSVYFKDVGFLPTWVVVAIPSPLRVFRFRDPDCLCVEATRAE